MQSSVGHGVRSRSATAYYDPFSQRPNLHVVVDTTVTRVLAESNNPKAFRKVEVARSAAGIDLPLWRSLSADTVKV